MHAHARGASVRKGGRAGIASAMAGMHAGRPWRSGDDAGQGAGRACLKHAAAHPTPAGCGGGAQEGSIASHGEAGWLARAAWLARRRNAARRRPATIGGSRPQGNPQRLGRRSRAAPAPIEFQVPPGRRRAAPVPLELCGLRRSHAAPVPLELRLVLGRCWRAALASPGCRASTGCRWGAAGAPPAHPQRSQETFSPARASAPGHEKRENAPNGQRRVGSSQPASRWTDSCELSWELANGELGGELGARRHGRQRAVSLPTANWELAEKDNGGLRARSKGRHAAQHGGAEDCRRVQGNRRPQKKGAARNRKENASKAGRNRNPSACAYGLAEKDREGDRGTVHRRTSDKKLLWARYCATSSHF